MQDGLCTDGGRDTRRSIAQYDLHDLYHAARSGICYWIKQTVRVGGLAAAQHALDAIMTRAIGQCTVARAW